MAQSIFKFYRSKPTTMWFQLSEEEQARFAAQSGILLEKVGAKALVVCNAYWSNEEWPIFGVEEFPSMEALQEHSKLLTEGGWMRYFVSQTMLGTTWGE